MEDSMARQRFTASKGGPIHEVDQRRQSGQKVTGGEASSDTLCSDTHPVRTPKNFRLRRAKSTVFQWFRVTQSSSITEY